jgi:hypothetical protein
VLAVPFVPASVSFVPLPPPPKPPTFPV